MTERRSTRIKQPTAKVRKASKSPTNATRQPPTPPPTPRAPSIPESILKGRASRKRGLAATVPKRVTVSAPLPPPRPFPLQPPRPSEWPSAYLWTPLPQTPLTPLSLNASARRAKLLLQLLTQRYDFHLHALRPAKEKMAVYRNSANVLQEDLWKLDDWRVENLYDFEETEKRLRIIGGTRGLERRIGRSHRRIEEVEGELERAERVLRTAERRLDEMEGEWYELLFSSGDEAGSHGQFGGGDEESDLGEDTDVDSILALMIMNMPLAATIQLGSNLEHRALVEDLSTQLRATQIKVGQLQRELEAAKEEVSILFPQPSASSTPRRSKSSRRIAFVPREHGVDNEEQMRKGRPSFPHVARLVGALASMRRREQELETLLSNAEEYARNSDAELCERAVMGIDGSASTIGMLSPSTPVTPRRGI